MFRILHFLVAVSIILSPCLDSTSSKAKEFCTDEFNTNLDMSTVTLFFFLIVAHVDRNSLKQSTPFIKRLYTTVKAGN